MPTKEQFESSVISPAATSHPLFYKGLSPMCLWKCEPNPLRNFRRWIVSKRIPSIFNDLARCNEQSCDRRDDGGKALLGISAGDPRGREICSPLEGGDINPIYCWRNLWRSRKEESEHYYTYFSKTTELGEGLQLVKLFSYEG
mmetsp:Transcript_6898/g.12087  ORF Transcript_6898/g.12087 Transcript_6898/m.12087 type:complete len:143 (+) Transcript_6898:301-729(+)